MTLELQQLESAILALDAQRALHGDAVTETALAPLRARRDALLAATSAAEPAAPATSAAASAAPAPEPLLKQVTVLFLDVVGSTALSQHLDPEDIHHSMDGRLAAFGASGSHEDDPERAVHAGLALLAEGRAQGEAVRRRFGHAGFDVRVGIHTGSVLLGGGVAEGGAIRGSTVNMAARMEQRAPASGLRISHDTYLPRHLPARARRVRRAGAAAVAGEGPRRADRHLPRDRRDAELAHLPRAGHTRRHGPHAAGARHHGGGRCPCSPGDRPAALTAFEEARTPFEAVDTAPHIAITTALIAEHRRLAGHLARARVEANRALEALAGGVSLDGTGEAMRVRHLCGKVLQAADDARTAPG